MLYVVTTEEERDAGSFFYDKTRVATVLEGPEGLDFQTLEQEFNTLKRQRHVSNVAEFVAWLQARINGLAPIQHAVVTLESGW